jgi:hypothetical protein
MDDRIKQLAEINVSNSRETTALQNIAQDVWSRDNFTGLNLGFARFGYNSETHSAVAGLDMSLAEMDLSLGKKMGIHFELQPDDQMHRYANGLASWLSSKIDGNENSKTGVDIDAHVPISFNGIEAVSPSEGVHYRPSSILPGNSRGDIVANQGVEVKKQ